ncbi:MAG TPA: hypothetical protein VFO91_01495 [Anaerolineales bacterium]|nr:hypothetical protein [Anaerolineales bacterium]
MTPFDLSRFAGWAAYVSGITTVLGVVTLFAFFAVGEPFGTINDLSSIVIALSMIVILFELDSLHRPVAPVVSLVVLIVGVIAMLVAVVFQTLLVLQVIEFAQTAVIVPLAFGVFGAALMIYSYLSLTSQSLPRGLAVLGIIAGASYILVITGFFLNPEGEHPLTIIGGLLILIGYPIWAIWFGRLLLAGRLAP